MAADITDLSSDWLEIGLKQPWNYTYQDEQVLTNFPDPLTGETNSIVEFSNDDFSDKLVFFPKLDGDQKNDQGINTVNLEITRPNSSPHVVNTELSYSNPVTDVNNRLLESVREQVQEMTEIVPEKQFSQRSNQETFNHQLVVTAELPNNLGNNFTISENSEDQDQSVTIDSSPSVQISSTNVATFDSTHGYNLVDAAQAVARALEVSTFNNVADSGGNSWGYEMVKAPEVWEKGYTGKGIVVAIVDTGVDYNHDDLNSNIWRNPGEIAGDGIDNDGNGRIDDIFGWDFVDNDNDPMDLNSHGTHLAGVIAAEKNSFGITGVAYNAQIMPVRVLDENGGGRSSNVAAGIRYAAAQGADIINISLGTNSSSRALEDAILDATSLGSLVVMAAGNDGDAQPDFPARYATHWGIAVGAVDSDGEVADFSNQAGDTPLAYVAAPGVSIYSTIADDSRDYSYKSGTSMATPYVAGVAALIKEANPELTGVEIRQILTGQKGFTFNTGYEDSLIDSSNSLTSEDRTYVGDFNGDGSDELLMFTPDFGNRQTAYHVERDSQGLFVQKSEYNGSFQNSPYTLSDQDQVEIGDFDGDGIDELMVFGTNYRGINVAYQVKSSRDGVFTYETGYEQNFLNSYHPLNSNDRTYVGDFNGDGADEMVIFSTYNENQAIGYHVERNDQGEFVRVGRYNGTLKGSPHRLRSSDRVEVGDFDGDGADELMVFSFNNRGVGVAYHAQTNSRGLLSYQQGYDNSIYSSYPLRRDDRTYVGDFNGDGSDELIIVTSHYSGQEIAYHLERNSQGEFVRIGGYTNYFQDSDYLLNRHDRVTVDDFDGDGSDELLIFTSQNNTEIAYQVELNSQGLFAAQNGYEDNLQLSPYDLQSSDRFYTGDFNGDFSSELWVSTTENSGLEAAYEVDFVN